MKWVTISEYVDVDTGEMLRKARVEREYKKIKNTSKTTVEAETLETKIKRMVSNSEPIGGLAPIVHTLKADGVISAYNIRADKWGDAVDNKIMLENSIAEWKQEDKEQKEAKVEAEKEAKKAKMEVVKEIKIPEGGDSGTKSVQGS